MKKHFGKISALVSSLALTAAMTCTSLASTAVDDGGKEAMTRYLIIGGIILAIAIGFYVYLSIKTKKK